MCVWHDSVSNIVYSAVVIWLSGLYCLIYYWPLSYSVFSDYLWPTMTTVSICLEMKLISGNLISTVLWNRSMMTISDTVFILYSRGNRPENVNVYQWLKLSAVINRNVANENVQYLAKCNGLQYNVWKSLSKLSAKWLENDGETKSPIQYSGPLKLLAEKWNEIYFSIGHSVMIWRVILLKWPSMVFNGNDILPSITIVAGNRLVALSTMKKTWLLL